MSDFKIQTIICRSTTQTFGGHHWKVEVVVRMDSDAWKIAKRMGHLGGLYGVDISNEVHRINKFIPAWNPTVDDKQRARAGIKTIFLTYYVSDPKQAEGMGMKVTYLKNGEFLPGFGDIAFLYDSRVKLESVGNQLCNPENLD